jgi:hypothetical protein
MISKPLFSGAVQVEELGSGSLYTWSGLSDETGCRKSTLTSMSKWKRRQKVRKKREIVMSVQDRLARAVITNPGEVAGRNNSSLFFSSASRKDDSHLSLDSSIRDRKDSQILNTIMPSS